MVRHVTFYRSITQTLQVRKLNTKQVSRALTPAQWNMRAVYSTCNSNPEHVVAIGDEASIARNQRRRWRCSKVKLSSATVESRFGQKAKIGLTAGI